VSQTPNFGLSVDDIHYNPPNAADEEGPASRLTLHHFADLPRLGCISLPTTLMRGSHKTSVNGHLLSLLTSSMPRPL